MTVTAEKTQAIYRETKEQATLIGMKVNSLKTQQLCISASRAEVKSTFVPEEGGPSLESTNQLKIVGFYFGTKPDASAHIERLIQKFHMRVWVLRQLKRSKVPADDILHHFKTLVRPVIDFACVTYHSLLTLTQTEELERLQREALKITYGWAVSYRAALEHSGLTPLSERRQVLVDQFAKKAAACPKFSRKWFDQRNYPTDISLRRREKYRHQMPRTERFKKNPVCHMKVRLELIENIPDQQS